MNNHKPAVRYFLYVRKSTDAEDRQMASLTDQEEVMHRLALERGLEVVDVIREAKSAKQPGRAGFNQLLSRISKGEANGILCWKLNRLARNPVDGGQISWMLQNGVIRHIQTFASDYKPEDNVLMMQVEFGIANQYIKNLSQDVKRGMAQKARRGWCPQRKLPLGYLHKSDYALGEKEIIADPKTYLKLKRFWQLLVKGQYSVPEIERLANSSGLRNPKGKPYSLSSFYRIFNNPFYYGEFEWPDEHGDMITYEGKHPPMVSKRDFMKVQVALGQRGRPDKYVKYSFLYRDLFTCGECGCAVTAEHKVKTICQGCGRKFSLRTSSKCPDCSLDVSDMDKPTITNRIYYRCTKKRGLCSQKYLTEETLEEQLHDILEGIDLPKVFVDIFLAVLNQEAQQALEDKKATLDELKDNQKTLTKRLDALVDMRMDGEIHKEQFEKKKALIEGELIQAEDLVESFSLNQVAWAKEMEKEVMLGKEVLGSFKKASDEQKKAMIRGFGSNPTLKGQKLYFSMPKVLYHLKEVATAYQAEIDRFEPAKTFILQDENGDILPLIRVLRGVVQMARTHTMRRVLKIRVTPSKRHNGGREID